MDSFFGYAEKTRKLRAQADEAQVALGTINARLGQTLNSFKQCRDITEQAEHVTSLIDTADRLLELIAKLTPHRPDVLRAEAENCISRLQARLEANRAPAVPASA